MTSYIPAKGGGVAQVTYKPATDTQPEIFEVFIFKPSPAELACLFTRLANYKEGPC